MQIFATRFIKFHSSYLFETPFEIMKGSCVETRLHMDIPISENKNISRLEYVLQYVLEIDISHQWLNYFDI